MQPATRQSKRKLDYPAETNGSRLAARARKLANRHTPEQRRTHLDAAMAMIYGAHTEEAALPRR